MVGEVGKGKYKYRAMRMSKRTKRMRTVCIIRADSIKGAERIALREWTVPMEIKKVVRRKA